VRQKYLSKTDEQMLRARVIMSSDYVIEAMSDSDRVTKKVQARDPSVQFKQTVETVLLLLLSLCQLIRQLQLPAARATHCTANGVVRCEVWLSQ